MKKIYIIISFLMIAFAGQAQQDLMISQYMFNHLALNPGYAGSKDYMMATLLYRNQWTSYDGKGAPVTQLATLHGPWKGKKFGWGVTVTHDHIGITDRTDAFFDLAYHLRVSDKYKLGMGIRVGMSHFKADFSELIYWDKSDPRYIEGTQTKTLPNTGAGFFLYSDKVYVGLSVPCTLSYDSTESISINEGSDAPHKVRHYYGTAGVAIPLSLDVVMKPSVLVKFVPDAPVEADLNLHFLFNDMLWIGATYRTGDAVVAMVEFQLTRKLRIGYAYDYTLTDIQDYSAGSHEIMLGYDFGYDIMKIKTPRYF
jgi:type IX secretion system PorP/SprF family membrane protein